MPIFVYPLVINGVDLNIRDVRELLFESLAIIAIGLAIKNKWIFAFLFWAVANWWFNFFMPPHSVAVLFNIAFGFLFFYFIKTYVKDIDVVLKVICWTALVQVAYLIVQYMNVDYIFYPITAAGAARPEVKAPLVGFLGNKNVLGVYLAFCLPLFRVYYRWLIPVILFALFITKCSMGIVAGVAALIFFEFFSSIATRKYWKLGVVILLSAGLLVGFFLKIDTMGLERVEIWKECFKQTFGWRSVVGRGMARFKHMMIIDETGTEWTNPHNEYIQIYFELGLIGLLIFLGYFVDTFRKFLRMFKDRQALVLASGVVAVLISCIGMFPFQLAPTALVAITYIALLEGLCQHRLNTS